MVLWVYTSRQEETYQGNDNGSIDCVATVDPRNDPVSFTGKKGYGCLGFFDDTIIAYHAIQYLFLDTSFSSVIGFRKKLFHGIITSGTRGGRYKDDGSIVGEMVTATVTLEFVPSLLL